MWGVKTSDPWSDHSTWGCDHQAGRAAPADPTSAQDCQAPRPLAKDHTWRRKKLPVFFLHCSLSSPDGFKYLNHFHNCHISLYTAVRVLLSSHLGFLLRHVHVCLHLIILFNSSLSLLEWHFVTAASPVAFVLTCQPFLPASVLGEAQPIIFLMTFLPGTTRETSNRTLHLST